jgi:hypothetical protein
VKVTEKVKNLVAAGQQALAQTQAEPWRRLNDPVVAQQLHDISHAVVHRRTAMTALKVPIDPYPEREWQVGLEVIGKLAADLIAIDCGDS